MQHDVPIESKLLLRVEEAAALASVGRCTAYELAASGAWPSVRVGRAVRIPRAGLIAWIERNTGKATA